jgi:glycosyltransferase involved in cell wall biosynthesis
LKKVLFIAYYFPPIGGGGVYRSISFSRFLPGEGYLPVIITGPGQPSRWAPYDASLSVKIPSYLNIYRISTPPPIDNSHAMNRICRWLYLTLPFSKWWIQSAIEMGEKAIAGEDISLIYATMSPYESADIASYLSIKFNIPWVADLRDPWALDEMTMYPTIIHKKLELIKMKHLLQNASLIIMNTNESATKLKKTFPLFRSKKVITITNGFDKNDFSYKAGNEDNDYFKIVHSGSLWSEIGMISNRKQLFYKISKGFCSKVDILGRSPIVLLDALKKWFERSPKVKEDVNVIFVGNMTDADNLLINNSSISNNVIIKGYLSHIDNIKMVRTADLLFLPMHNLSSGERSTTMPGKTYEYMATGRPILAAVPDGDAKDILSKCGTSFICSPDDVENMINIINKVYDSWKNKSEIIHPDWNYIYQFERKNQVKKLALEFNEILKNYGTS